MTTGPGVEQVDAVAPTRLQRAAERCGFTEGQLYTAVIGLVLATSLAVLGVPPTLREPLAAAPGSPVAPSVPPPPPVVVPSAGPSVNPPLQPLQPLSPLAGPPLAAPPPLDVVPPPQAPLSPAPADSPQSGVVSVFARVAGPGAPAAVAQLPSGDVVVGTNNTEGASSVLVLDRSGTLLRSVPVTGQPEQRTSGLVAAAADSSGRAFLLDGSTSRVLELAPGGKAVTTRATIPNVPLCLFAAGAPACEAGLQDRTGRVSAVAVDGRGALYVADAGQGIIWRLLADESVAQPWYQSSDFTTGDGQAGLAFDREGRLLFTTGTSNDLANSGKGGLYRLALNDDGSAGARTLVHPFAEGDRPGALTAGASGTAYVVVRGSSAIVSIDPSGAEVGRLAPPGDAGVPLDNPAGLTMTPGYLLVANQGSAEKQANSALLTVLVDDQPVAHAR